MRTIKAAPLLTIICLCGIFSIGAQGASVYKKALDKKLNAYLDEGVIVGGRAGTGYSLLNARRDLSDKMGVERLILELGDIEGHPLRSQAGFFHASVEKNPPRVVIDLSQLSRSAVSEARLREIFKKSPNVKNVELTSDPEDRSATLVLHLKNSVALEAFELPANGKASRLVFDLKKVLAKK